MKSNFINPTCEVVRFTNDNIVTLSNCGCYYEETGDLGEGADVICPGANINCECAWNYDDLTKGNCVTPGS